MASRVNFVVMIFLYAKARMQLGVFSKDITTMSETVADVETLNILLNSRTYDLPFMFICVMWLRDVKCVK